MNLLRYRGSVNPSTCFFLIDNFSFQFLHIQSMLTIIYSCYTKAQCNVIYNKFPQKWIEIFIILITFVINNVHHTITNGHFSWSKSDKNYCCDNVFMDEWISQYAIQLDTQVNVLFANKLFIIYFIGHHSTLISTSMIIIIISTNNKYCLKMFKYFTHSMFDWSIDRFD